MAAKRFARRDASRRRLAASGSGTAEAAALAIVLVAAFFLFRRGLSLPPSFDEAVYVAQTQALLHGQHLGTQVFAAQPPGFYWLLELAAKLGGSSLHDLRVAVLVIALAGVVAAWLVARRVAGPWAGVLAAAVLTVAPPYPTFAAQVSADLPGLVLALFALACLLRARGPWAFAVGGGVLFAAAELVKLDAFFVVLPALAFVALRRLAVAGAAALGVAGVTAAVLAGSIGDVWHGAITYHLTARGHGGRSENAHALRSFFDLRQPLTWLTAAGLAASAARRRGLWPFWAAAAAGALFLLWHRPLHDNHMVLLAVLLAVPIACALVPTGLRRAGVATAVLVLVLAAAYVQETRRLDRNAGPVPPELVWAAARVDAHSTPSQLVVSDEPIVPVLAGRRMPGNVIDTAVLRFDSGYLSDRDVLAAVAGAHVPVVVAGRAFLQRPALLAALAHRFPSVETRNGVRVYSR